MRRAHAMIAAAVLSTSVFAMQSHGADIDWLAPATGYFDETHRWAGGVVPGASDTARFNVAGFSQVLFDDFSGDRTNAVLLILAGEVVFSRNTGSPRTYSTGLLTVDNAARFHVTDMTVAHSADINLNRGSRVDVNAGGLLNGSGVSVVRLGSGGTATENRIAIQSGGRMSSRTAHIGEAAGLSGRVTVDGSASSWTASQDIYVGRNGIGHLEITNGAIVTNQDGWLGWNAGSTGDVTLSGANSTWTNSRNLSLGDSFSSGVGNLTINANARLNVGDTSASGTISGILVGDANLGGGNGGELFVYNGSTLTNASGGVSRIGLANGFGRVLVSGTNSKFLHSNGSGLAVAVDTNATGKLDILAGGWVESSGITVGGFGGTGTVTVSGTNSTLKVGGLMQLSSPAGAGTGIVNVNSGGKLFVGNTSGDFNSTMDVTVNAAGPLDGTSGILTIANGSTLTNDLGAFIGVFAGNSGRVVVRDANSTWNTAHIQIGESASGELTLQDGGRVNTANVFAGEFSAGSGTLNVLSGSRMDTTFQVVLAEHATTTGVANVSGAGSVINVGTQLEVGRGGNGTLNLNTGGVLNAGNAIVGVNAGSVGTINLDAAATLDINSRLEVGVNGSGTFNANNGKVLIGDVATYAPASLENTTISASAPNPSGHLAIKNGGVYSGGASTYITMGRQAGSFGNVVITGANSTLDSMGFAAGFAGTGRLDITAGAVARTAATGDVYAGFNNGSNGTIVVDGNGSALKALNNLILGGNGTARGTVTATNNASIYVGDASDLNLPGTLVISNTDNSGTAGGVLLLNNDSTFNFAGVVSIGPNINGGQYGRLQLNAPTGSFTSNDSVSVNTHGTLNIQAGKFETTGPTGSVTVMGAGKVNLSGGELITRSLHAALANPNAISFTGGRLNTENVDVGTGRTFTQAGGTFAVKGLNSIEKTNLFGSYALNGGTVEFLLGAGSDSILLVSENVTLNGGTLSIGVIDYTPVLGDAYSIILSTGITGRFATVTGVQYSPTRSFAITYDADEVFYVVARPGDANIDGIVNFDDLLTLAQNYGPATGKHWVLGDFTGNGLTDFDDLLILAQNYGQSGLTLPDGFNADFAADWALAQSMVPEPTMLLAFLPAVAFRRRRHTN